MMATASDMELERLEREYRRAGTVATLVAWTDAVGAATRHALTRLQSELRKRREQDQA